jgi:hypothetical protein
MKKIAVLQSNYIPWRGYFDLINMVDEFIIYDDVQYTKNDWRNRNKIKSKEVEQWLTIPVSQNSLKQSIKETKISNQKWNIKHWKSIQQNYSKTKYFNEYGSIFEKLYLESNETYLSEVNVKFLKAINNILNIQTKIIDSSVFNLPEDRNEKLIEICKSTQADIYLSGPSAQSYINTQLFNKNNIKLEWMDYSNYKEYKQQFPPFSHNVSIIDLLFNEGKNAHKYMKSFN